MAVVGFIAMVLNVLNCLEVRWREEERRVVK
jgi:hypothetical protein